MPPPNMSERPPPFPLCMRTSSPSRKLKMMRAIENPVTTAGPTLSEGRMGRTRATALRNPGVGDRPGGVPPVRSPTGY
ncbi:hypothetical protein GCM10009716_29590 [Streptomyces sodiiphilus]|uniref:Uncharacterized protein n=1 Tax=Streptomyces sodiiphilus TaxID=226217 RepID=A0ABN2PGT9_9ACTN